MSKQLRSSFEPEDDIREAASRWIVRQDRTLTEEEQCELNAWLEADSRHGAEYESARHLWQTTRAIGSAMRQLPAADSPSAPPRRSWAVIALLAAAAVVIGVFLLPRTRVPAGDRHEPMIAQASKPVSRTRTLEDGTIVSLRGDAEIVVHFSTGERRVKLLRGESYFAVTPNRDRPFIVDAGNTQIRVVGTSFAIRFAPDAVDVLVTEGTVHVNPSQPDSVLAPNSSESARSAVVTAGHRASVRPYAGVSRVTVTPASRSEINRELAWNEPMLELAGATLGELAARFSRATGRAIEIEASLATARLGGQLPASDVEGFVTAIETIYPVKAERRADGSILLRRAP
ncbi:MAG: FecR domain-containing protein [Opitutaceae bacterium]|nr:FecR domain-containing protein [Opitutaceae bacterium]